MIKILIMGKSGSGKTTLATELNHVLTKNNKSVTWFNADIVRKQYNDWDFSKEGRIRQSLRMKELASKATTDVTICDFIAPLPEMRSNFDPDYIIWLDTELKSKFEDDDAMFSPPVVYHLRITEKNAKKWAVYFYDNILHHEWIEQFEI